MIDLLVERSYRFECFGTILEAMFIRNYAC